ncbi:PPE domain-containing protein, partial [Mycobacterium marinum]|uniref:PPE domain-containing protein n=1 Tax=Mycobacterium marinum TaxID=1781 RepID=UPI003FF0EF0F
MTKPINVQVVPEELMGRASELESLIAAPTASLKALCALPMVVNATADLVFSANAMLTYIDAGNKARQQLADALREAAKSYVGTDEQVEQALNAGGGAVSAVAPRGVLGAHALGAGAGLGGVRSGLLAAPSTVPPAPPYYPVRTAAAQIAEPDQGTSFNAFAAAWTAYQQPLLDSTEAFRPFQNWQGEAATAVEANFEQFRQWVYQIADLCKQLVAQVQGISSAHSWAVTQHPTVAQLDKLDKSWNQVQRAKIAAEHDSAWIRNMELAILKGEEKALLKKYTDYQNQSESVLTEYTKKANLPLSPLNPPVPPTAYSPPA